MSAQSICRGFRTLAIASFAAFALVATAYAHGGGRGGGGHADGFGSRGVAHGGFGGRYDYRGVYGGGYRGYRGWYGGHGWGWGWPGYGLFLYSLPYGYSTFWWDGVPYYYADDNYYLWNDSIEEYEPVNPPPEVVNQASTQPPPNTDLFAYPKNGQTPAQQALDKQQCRSWATAQTGFNPVQPNTAAPPNAIADNSRPATPAAKRADYLRAQAACFEALGYSVK